MVKERIKFGSISWRLGLLFTAGLTAVFTVLFLVNGWIIEFTLANPSLTEEIIEKNKLASYTIGFLVLFLAAVVFLFATKFIRSFTNKVADQSEELLKTSERLHRFFQNSSDLIYELDADGKYVYINDTVERKMGISLEDLKGKICWEFVPKEYLAATKEYYLGVIMRREKSGYHEFPIFDRDGNYLWLGQSVDFVYEGSKVMKAYTVAMDITDLKKDERKKDKYSEGLRLLNELGAKRDKDVFELFSEGLTLCTEFLSLELGIISKVEAKEYMIIDFVPSGAGLERGQKFELGNTYCDITLKAEKPISIDEMSTSEYNAHPCYNNFKLESYIGAAYYVNDKVRGTVNFTSTSPRSEPFTDYDIDFITLVARWIGSLIEDDEERRKMEKEQSILEAFVSAAPAAIAMLDNEMKYLAVSQKWRNNYKIKEEVRGIHSYDILPVPEKQQKMFQRALKGEIVGKEEQKFETAAGKVMWLKWEIRPWYDANKEIGGVITYTDDITSMKLQQEELKKAKEEAEISGRIKEQFLSTMSHEIRTPLNAIIGTTNLLELEHPELAGNDRMRLLKFGSSNLLSLINDVLDFQKIESGNLVINKSDFNLKELVRNIVETWEGVARERDINLTLNYDEGLSHFYEGDSVRLSQIFNNLMSNALKFTDEGAVNLKVTNPKKGIIQFEIKDTGIGIPEDRIEHIFESFKQLSNDQTSKRGGTGLGLSISKKLASLLGGDLIATSKMGIGSKFSFAIPMEPSADQEKKPVASYDLKKMNLKALLVEDNSANQAIATSFLDRWGIKVQIANNGQEALEEILDQSYDFVLMDIRMPVMGGYEASKRIREMEGDYFSKVPIIALTASTLFDAKDKMKESGINASVCKPFDPKDLFQQIAKITSIEIKQPEEKNEVGSFKFLSQFFGDDFDQIHKVVNKAIESIDVALIKIEKGFKEKDKKMMDDGFHTLRPNLSYVDLEQFIDRIPHLNVEDELKIIPNLLEEIRIEMKKIKTDVSTENHPS